MRGFTNRGVINWKAVRILIKMLIPLLQYNPCYEVKYVKNMWQKNTLIVSCSFIMHVSNIIGIESLFLDCINITYIYCSKHEPIACLVQF